MTKYGVSNFLGLSRAEKGLEAYRPITQLTASKVLGTVDFGRFLVNSTTSNITISVPAIAAINFEVGTEIYFAREGTGTLSFNNTGVTFNGDSSPVDQGELVILKHISADAWRFYRVSPGSKYAITDIAANYTLTASDCNVILRCINAADITITVDTNANAAIPIGAENKILRTGGGGVEVAFAGGVTSVDGPRTFPATPYGLRREEWLGLTKLAADEWKIGLDPNYAVYSIADNFRTAWQVTASGVQSVVIPASVWAGAVAVGTDTDTLGGLMCASVGALGASTATITDTLGNHLNAIAIRSSTFNWLTTSNNRQVFGLVQTAHADGATNAGSTQVSFVEWDPTTQAWQNTTVTRTVQLALRFAIPIGWMPYTIP